MEGAAAGHKNGSLMENMYSFRRQRRTTRTFLLMSSRVGSTQSFSGHHKHVTKV